MNKELGRLPDGTGLSQVEPASAVSPLRASIPSAGVMDDVEITAADFNGQSFDGCPFSHVPKWLLEALESEHVKVEPSDTDYAMWMVDSACGPVVSGPGDRISHYQGILTVIPYDASAIEARRAATLGAVHESAGLQGDAQTSPPKDL